MYFIFQTKKINYWESETCMTIFFITYLQPYHLLNGTSTKEIVNDEKKKKPTRKIFSNQNMGLNHIVTNTIT